MNFVVLPQEAYYEAIKLLIMQKWSVIMMFFQVLKTLYAAFKVCIFHPVDFAYIHFSKIWIPIHSMV